MPFLNLEPLSKKNCLYMDTKEAWEKNSKDVDNPTIKYYRENPIEYKFNNCGFRTPDDFNDIDQGNIFLGCSHTVGIGHHLENTWSYKLNEHIGGKFWNLGQGGSGVNTAFRLLYGFKDYLKGKTIFHFGPYYHAYRYEFIIDSKPIQTNILYNDGKYAKKFLGDMLVEQSLVNDEVAHLDYRKNIYAIKSLAKEIGIDYHILGDEIFDDLIEDNSILARDLTHFSISKQNHIYKSFLKII